MRRWSLRNISWYFHEEDGQYYSECECGNPIKSKRYYLDRHSGKCRSCCVKKPPFFHLFTKLKNTAKHEKHPIDITFEEFLEFTKIGACHYCHDSIPWKAYCYENSRYRSGSYFLDRKDNALGYTKENIAVCCSRCNISKSDRYSYEEWLGMTNYLRKQRGI